MGLGFLGISKGNSTKKETVNDYSNRDQIGNRTEGEENISVGKVGGDSKIINKKTETFIEIDNDAVDSAFDFASGVSEQQANTIQNSIDLAGGVAEGAFALSESYATQTNEAFLTSLAFSNLGSKQFLDFASADREVSYQNTTNAFESINHNLDTALSFVEDQNAPDGGLTKDLVKIIGLTVVGIAAVLAFKGK